MRRAIDAPVCQRVLRPTRGDGSMQRFIRYSMVSAVAIVISQATILVCAWVFGLSGIAANTIGAVVATPASYELNRKWAWRKGGKSHLWREVVPFWALTIIGWLASTGTVEIADSLCKSHGVTGLARAIAIMGASLFAYGVVWIGKFFLFNRLIFATTSEGGDDTAREAVEAGVANGASGTVPVAPVPLAPVPVAAAPVATAPVATAPVLDGTVFEGNPGGGL
ncbi:MAG TPA: GtrA family protein [Acidimicrobiales bacterium]|nr:GtrA family protein [Acidimicrobiales bacterium]